MQPEFFRTFAELREHAQKVRNLYSDLETFINPVSDLGRYLIEIEGSIDLDDASVEPEIGRLVGLARAGRVVDAILSAAGKLSADGTMVARETLRRIAKNPVDLGQSGVSQGKDALWELEFFLYAQRREIAASIEDPDINLALPFGTYGIACKKINSMNKLRERIKDGSDQVHRHGVGCVALNFDAFSEISDPLCSATPRDAGKEVQGRLNVMLASVMNYAWPEIEAGYIDGVILSMTCVVKIGISHSAIDTFTQTVFSHGKTWSSREAKERFRCFQEMMCGPMATDQNGFPVSRVFVSNSPPEAWS